MSFISQILTIFESSLIIFKHLKFKYHIKFVPIFIRVLLKVQIRITYYQNLIAFFLTQFVFPIPFKKIFFLLLLFITFCFFLHLLFFLIIFPFLFIYLLIIILLFIFFILLVSNLSFSRVLTKSPPLPVAILFHFLLVLIFDLLLFKIVIKINYLKLSAIKII